MRDSLLFPITWLASCRLRLVLLALAVLPIMGRAQTPAATFALQANSPNTGTEYITYPYSVAVADVNGDGKLDVLTASPTNRLSILLGDGKGGFTLQSNSPSTGENSNPYSMALGDVNGDGKLDAVTANFGNNTLSILLGDGKGGFTLQPNSPRTGPKSEPEGIALADVNSDGKLDVLTANTRSGTLGVLLGDGQGGFTLQANSPSTGTRFPYAVALADVNSDEKLDALTINGDVGTLSVLLGDGIGGFTLQTDSPFTGSYPRSLTLADVNGDGKIDALTANISSNTLGVLLGDGKGRFTLQGNSPSTGTNSEPEAVTLADVNGDGFLDALTANYGSGTLSILLGDGQGGFTLQPNSPSTGTYGQPRALALADVNGDGKIDALVANSRNGTLGILLNTTMVAVELVGLSITSGPVGTAVTLIGTGFSGATSISFGGKAAAFSINSDTKATTIVPAGAATGSVTITTPSGTSNGLMFTVTLPLAITAISPAANALSVPRSTPVRVTFNQALTEASSSALKVFSSQRGGLRTSGATTAVVSGSTLTYTPTRPFLPGETVSSTVTTAAASANGSLSQGKVVQFTTAVTGTGRGNFQRKSNSAGAYTGLYTTPADVDGDGDADLIYISSNRAYVSLNNGSGIFTPGSSVAVGMGATRVTAADVDGDGDLDLLTANPRPNLDGNTISIRLNNGTGVFTGTSEVTVGTGPTVVAMADVDGDGDLDLLVSNLLSNTVSIRFNNGSGSFSGRTEVAVGLRPADVVAGDVDGDGDLDLLTANYFNGGDTPTSVSVRLNNGRGVFSGGSDLIVLCQPRTITLADVDGDGDLDFIAAGNTGANVGLNNGQGFFTIGSAPAVGSAATYITTADVDGDGDLDLITAKDGQTPANVSVRLNNGQGVFTGGSNLNLNSLPWTIAVVDADGDGDMDIITDEGVYLNNPAAPTVAISSTASNPTYTSPIPVTVTFSEAVTGFIATDVVVGNGTLSVFTGSGKAYYFEVTPTASGVVTVDVAANVATDAAGSGNALASQYSITYSQAVTAAPVVTTPANGSLLNTTTLTYAGTAPAASTVTVLVDGTAIGTTTATAGGNWALSQPTALSQGTHKVRAAAQTSGSTVSANSNTNNFTVDSARPSVAISSSATSPTSTSPIPVTVTFSESVTGFLASDVMVSNGTLSGFAGSGMTYTFNVTPAADGIVTVNVAANGATDAAGNGNVAAAQFSIQYAAPVTATIWTGTVSTDWFTAGNWTSGVPTSTLDATIPAGTPRYPVLTAGTANAQALTLAGGATLSQSGGTLVLTGSFSNAGTFNATGGLVSLNGNASQALGGPSRTSFWNLTVGTSGAGLSGPADVQRVLTLNGILATNNQPFTLLSDANATAMVVNNDFGLVSGNATMQRYLDPSLNAGPGYRHYSSPVLTITVGALTTAGFVPVVNPAYNTAADPGSITPFPTVYGYEQARLRGTSATTQAFEFGYSSPASLGEQLTRGRGYTVNISASEKVALTGTLTTDNLPVGTLSRGPEANAGWHLLGNPYPAPLDWNKARTGLPTGVIDAIYVFKSSSQYGGTYQTYQNGIGTLPGGLIPAMQGFFLRVSQNVPSFSFLSAWRATSYQNPTFNRTTADIRPIVQLDLVDAQGTREPAFIYFEAGATTGRDDHYDAEKLPNTTGLNLASVAATGEALAINGLPALGNEVVIVPLTVDVPQAGRFALAAPSLANLPATTLVELVDNQTGTRRDLRQLSAAGYAFTADSRHVAGRFVLNLRSNAVLASGAAALAAQVRAYPNPASGQLTISRPAGGAASAVLLNAVGQQLRTVTLPTTETTLSLAGLPIGVYALRVTLAGGQTVVQRVVVQ